MSTAGQLQIAFFTGLGAAVAILVDTSGSMKDDVPGDARPKYLVAREALETMLDAFNDDLPPLKDFILPGGGLAAAHCHVARTVCRRAEREVVTLSHHDAVRPEAIRYLNRLSDLLFVLARVLARESGHGEVLWQHERRKREKK